MELCSVLSFLFYCVKIAPFFHKNFNTYPDNQNLVFDNKKRSFFLTDK